MDGVGRSHTSAKTIFCSIINILNYRTFKHLIFKHRGSPWSEAIGRAGAGISRPVVGYIQ